MFSGINGVSRDTIYRHRRLIKEGGVQTLKRQSSEGHIHGNRTDKETAEVIIEISLDNPILVKFRSQPTSRKAIILTSVPVASAKSTCAKTYKPSPSNAETFGFTLIVILAFS